MSRITGKLTEAKRRGGGFIPFITAGDPDLPASLSIMLKLAELGGDVIELGVPFSDPMADGPTIQRSSQRAVDRGTSLGDVLSLAAGFRAQSDVPVVLFSYFNPILRFGVDAFATAAAGAGVDGVLLTDVVGAEADAISREFDKFGIDLISLVAPTTTDERIKDICRRARGFIYAVSTTGVTGVRETLASKAEGLVERVRGFTDLPVAVGFGISTRDQIADVWRYADAAVVGSAIVAEIEEAASPNDAVRQVGRLVEQLLPTVAKSGAEN